MIIDLTRLNNDIDKLIVIDNNVSFAKEYLAGTDLIDLKNVYVKGSIKKNSLNHYEMNANINGTMILPCAITLEPVEYEFDTEINEDLEEFLENEQKNQNSLDILPIIWENILMEIPMKVLSKNASNVKLEGDGWKLITEDDKEEINPEFEKLKDLL